MADSYKLTACAATASTAFAPSSSGVPVTDIPLDEELFLSLKSSQTIELISDAPVSVALPGPSSTVPGAPQANVLILKVVGPRVVAAITTPDGAAQTIPVDSLLILHTTTVSPITSLTLTRTAGNDTLAYVFLGQI